MCIQSKVYKSTCLLCRAHKIVTVGTTLAQLTSLYVKLSILLNIKFYCLLFWPGTVISRSHDWGHFAAVVQVDPKSMCPLGAPVSVTQLIGSLSCVTRYFERNTCYLSERRVQKPAILCYVIYGCSLANIRKFRHAWQDFCRSKFTTLHIRQILMSLIDAVAWCWE